LALEVVRDVTVNTDDWWIENAIGEEHEEIRCMAMRILPQPTAMTATDRDWKTYYSYNYVRELEAAIEASTSFWSTRTFNCRKKPISRAEILISFPTELKICSRN
jgi:hypothetical protein